MRKLTEAEIARAKDPRDKMYWLPEKTQSTPPMSSSGAHSVLLDCEYVFVDRESYERVCAVRGVEPTRNR